MNPRSFTPHATRTHTVHLVSTRRVAEDTGDYRADRCSASHIGKETRHGAVKRIEIEALRRTADAQIGRLLRLANLLDELNPESPETERVQATAGIRDAATLLEQHLHGLAEVAETAYPPQG